MKLKINLAFQFTIKLAVYQNTVIGKFDMLMISTFLDERPPLFQQYRPYFTILSSSLQGLMMKLPNFMSYVIVLFLTIFMAPPCWYEIASNVSFSDLFIGFVSLSSTWWHATEFENRFCTSSSYCWIAASLKFFLYPAVNPQVAIAIH